jgi:starch synthase
MPSRVTMRTESNVSLRYGTIYCEKNRRLKDTVIDFGDNRNGISHDQSSVGDICYSIQRAINLYKIHLNEIRQLGMNTDHSWEKHVKNI